MRTSRTPSCSPTMRTKRPKVLRSAIRGNRVCDVRQIVNRGRNGDRFTAMAFPPDDFGYQINMIVRHTCSSVARLSNCVGLIRQRPSRCDEVPLKSGASRK